MLENIHLLPHIKPEDSKAIEEIALDGEEWVKQNVTPDFETVQQKRMEIDAKFKPIRNSLYSAAGISLKEDGDDDEL